MNKTNDISYFHNAYCDRVVFVSSIPKLWQKANKRIAKWQPATRKIRTQAFKISKFQFQSNVNLRFNRNKHIYIVTLYMTEPKTYTHCTALHNHSSPEAFFSSPFSLAFPACSTKNSFLCFYLFLHFFTFVLHETNFIEGTRTKSKLVKKRKNRRTKIETVN